MAAQPRASNRPSRRPVRASQRPTAPPPSRERERTAVFAADDLAVLRRQAQEPGPPGAPRLEPAARIRQGPDEMTIRVSLDESTLRVPTLDGPEAARRGLRA